MKHRGVICDKCGVEALFRNPPERLAISNWLRLLARLFFKAA